MCLTGRGGKAPVLFTGKHVMEMAGLDARPVAAPAGGLDRYLARADPVRKGRQWRLKPSIIALPMS